MTADINGIAHTPQEIADFIDPLVDKIYLTDYPNTIQVGISNIPDDFWNLNYFRWGMDALRNKTSTNTIITPLFNCLQNNEGIHDWLVDPAHPEHTLFTAEQLFWTLSQDPANSSLIGDNILTHGSYQWIYYTHFPMITSYWLYPYCSNNEVFYVPSQPIACPASNTITACTGENLLFKYISNYENNVICSWDFDEGTLLSGVSPGDQNHIYNQPGTYVVKCQLTFPASNYPNSQAVCEYTSFERTVIINGAGISASGPTTFCQGNNVQLTATAGSSYYWTTPLGNHFSSQSITAIENGTYSVVVTNSNGCASSTASITVTVNTLPSVSITPASPSAICLGDNLTLTASSGGTFYSWSTGLSCATCSTITVSPQITTTYSVVMTGSNNCTNSASVVVTINQNCCGSPASQIISAPGNLTGTHSSPPNKSLNYNATVASGTVTFSGLDLSIAAGVTITVNSGAILRIESSSYLHACGAMWGGIINNGGTVIVNGSEIDDAITAVSASNSAPIQIDNSTFDHNWKSISLQNGDYSASHIYSSTFDCSGGVISKVSHLNARSWVQINLENVHYFKMGDETNSVNRNYINRSNYGIFAHNSNLDVSNNEFNFDYIGRNARQPMCYAIYGTTDYYGRGYPVSNPEYTLNVIGDQLDNTFINWPNGIATDQVHFATVTHNIFNHVLNAVIASKGENADIKNNEINESVNGMVCSNYKPRMIDITGQIKNINIWSNHFNYQSSYDAVNYGYCAILVDNVNQFPMPTEIYQNEIYNMGIGMHVRNNWTRAEMNAYYTGIPEADILALNKPNYGIWLENTKGDELYSNHIEWQNPPPTDASLLNLLKGIALGKSYDYIVQENSIHNMTAGMNVFEDCSVTKYICNGLHSCFHGFYLDDNSVNNKMTDQGTWNGSNGASWNNWWDNNYEDHVHGTVAPTCIFNWEYVSNQDDPQPTNIPFVNLPIHNVSNYILGCSPPAFAIDDEKRDEKYGAAVGDSTGSDFDSLEYSYNDKGAFYRDVKDNPSILYLGTPNDVFYLNKYAEYQGTDIGKFNDALAYLKDDDKTAAIQKLQDMLKPDVISQNNYFMGMLLANNYDPYLDADSDTISLVINISLQHLFYGGDAVYLARTMLHHDVFDVLPPLRRKNHSAPPVNETGYWDRFYPNPANRTVTFYSSLLFTENERLVICNSFGTITKKITLPKMQNTIAFDIGDLATSVYYAKIISTNSERKVQKLVIIQ